MTLTATDLTIIAASYRSADLLRLNIALTAALNPGNSPRWVIVDNNDDFGGVAPEDALLIQGDPSINTGKLRGSYHHAQSLNKAMQHVSTRYVLALDPDFFIIHTDWAPAVLTHMHQQNLVLWGAPYYPHASWKRRYVPAAYCMLIDLHKLPSQQVDFTPELDEYHALKERKTTALIWMRFGNIPVDLRHFEKDTLQDVAAVILRNRFVAHPLAWLMPKRFYTNTNIARDTGFKIQKRFAGHRRDVETLQPSFVNDLFSVKRSPALTAFAGLYATLVPETLSIYPKRRHYATTRRFADAGLPDLRGRFGWEEYFWCGVPFAFHLKGGTTKFNDVGSGTMQKILFDLTAKPGIMEALQPTHSVEKG